LAGQLKFISSVTLARGNAIQNTPPIEKGDYCGTPRNKKDAPPNSVFLKAEVKSQEIEHYARSQNLPINTYDNCVKGPFQALEQGNRLK
jgi:hypothetical protein